jgi:hypothetical protein
MKMYVKSLTPILPFNIAKLKFPSTILKISPHIKYRYKNSYDAAILNETSTREEIAKAVEHAKLLNACGIDEIHAEVLKNSTAIDLL